MRRKVGQIAEIEIVKAGAEGQNRTQKECGTNVIRRKSLEKKVGEGRSRAKLKQEY